MIAGLNSEKTANVIYEHKVSIITVCKNAEKTIRQTIESVINQTWRNIEYIVVDGASSDRTLSIIREYSDKISVLISEPDEGMYYALNKAIKKASGDIVGIINSDDWYEKNALERVINAFDINNVDVVYGHYYIMHDESVKMLAKNEPLDTIWHGMPMGHPTVFIKRDIYEKYGCFDTSYRIVADHELMLRFYSHGVRFCEIDSVLANFRLSGVSTHNRRAVIKEAAGLMIKYADESPDPSLEKEKIVSELKKEIENSYLMEPSTAVVEQIKSLFEPNEVLSVFGVGYWGGFVAGLLLKCGYKIDCFWDNNSDNRGKCFLGSTVKSPREMQDYKGTVIISPEKYLEDIQKQIREVCSNEIRIITLSDIRHIISCHIKRDAIIDEIFE